MTSWLSRLASRTAAVTRLFCFHPAWLSAAFFRQWPDEPLQDLEVFAIPSPGRANGLREEPVASISILAKHIVQSLSGHCIAPFAFFGHRMGAVLAAEVVHLVASEGMPLPWRLFVSSRRPVHVADPLPPLRHLSDSLSQKSMADTAGFRPRYLMSP
jgi:surfactin synthase thioesterase subunit